MKFLVVVIVAAITLAVAIAAHIKNDREWERAARAWRKDNEDLDRKACDLSREKKIAEKRIEEQAKEIGAMEEEYFCAQNEVEVLESKLRDANVLIKRYDGIFNGFNIVHDPSGVRECYLEIDGARSESCRAATVKWLMDLHAEPETEAGGKEGSGEERQPAEATEE